MSTITSYRYLEAEPGSAWQEWVIKGTGIRASTLVLAVRNDERTPEQVAMDFHIPVDAVREAIEYVDAHAEQLEERHRVELDDFVRLGHLNPDGTWKSISTTTPTKIA